MRGNKQKRESADAAIWTAHRRLRNSITSYRRSALFAAAAVALAAFTVTAFSATASSHAASRGKHSGSGSSTRSSRIAGRRSRSVATPATHDSVAGGHPVHGWGDNALYVQYADCMRANGYPTFPYPSGIEPDGHESTNFNGTGIDPNSPAFLKGTANQRCGKRIGAPAWWINNWGPPGSVDTYPAGTNPNNTGPSGPPPDYPKPTTGPGNNRGAGASTPSTSGG